MIHFAAAALSSDCSACCAHTVARLTPARPSDRSMSRILPCVWSPQSLSEPAQWVKADKVYVPTESLALSARILHEYFGEHELDRVIGGKTWWQRRLTPDGAVPAEWIEVPGTNDGERTMLYIHGGAGFFGSINTHRCVDQSVRH